MSRRPLYVMMLCLLLAACGEYPQSVPYENNGYQGKTDQRVWDSEAFFNDKATWKQIVNERTQKQNEYDRVEGH